MFFPSLPLSLPLTSTLVDLHILINTIHSPSIINSSAAASWLPICLPKFNPSAFVNAYVSFLRRGDDHREPATPPIGVSAPGAATRPQSPTTPTAGAGTSVHSGSAEGTASPVKDEADSKNVAASEHEASEQRDPHVDIGLVCVSGLADFEAVRGWCTTASEVRLPQCPRRAN